MKKSVDKNWKERLADFGTDVPENQWEMIEGKLPSSRKTSYYRWAAILLVLLLASGTSYYLGQQSVYKTLEQHSERIEIITPSNISSIDSSKESVPSKTNPLAERNTIEQFSDISDKQANSNQRNIDYKNETLKKDFAKDRKQESEHTADNQTINNKKVKNEGYPREAPSSKSKKGGESILLALEPRQAVIENIDFDLPTVTGTDKTENPIEKKREKNKSLTLYSNFQLFSSYNQIRPNLEDDLIIKDITSNALSIDRIGFKASLGMEKQLTPKIKIFGGISSLLQNQTLKYSYSTVIPDSVTVQRNENSISTMPVRESKEGAQYLHNFSIGMQIGAHYLLVDRNRLKQFFTLEIEPHAQLGDQTYFGKYQVYTNMAYTTKFWLNSAWAFKIAPTISYSMVSHQQANMNSFEVKPFSLGIDIGLSFHFKY